VQQDQISALFKFKYKDKHSFYFQGAEDGKQSTHNEHTIETVSIRVCMPDGCQEKKILRAMDTLNKIMQILFFPECWNTSIFLDHVKHCKSGIHLLSATVCWMK
jgi:hypothetical protein